MSAISKVLVRTIVIEFYKENAGFLLIVMGLGFGFLKTPQHIDIASALAFKPIFYLAPVALWALYAIKTLNFAFRIKRLPQNWFLTDVNALKRSKLKRLAIFIQVLLLAPVLGYSGFMIFIAVDLGQVSSVVILIIANLLILMTSAHFFYRRLIQPVDSTISNSFKTWTHLLPKSYPFLLIHHLAKRHGVSLLLAKLSSIAITLGASAVFHLEGIDLRLLALGILLSSAVNANFSFKYNEFEKTSLRLYRNLPVSKMHLLGNDIITYLILSLPEFLVFFGNNISHVSLIVLIKTALILPATCLLYHTIVRTKSMDIDQFVKYVFFITAFLFFVILGHVNLLFITATLLFIAVLLNLKRGLAYD